MNFLLWAKISPVIDRRQFKERVANRSQETNDKTSMLQ
jgi:hypothetical protein